MAADTNTALQNQLIYCIYVRAHTEEGTFKAIIPDLERIKALGTDIIWFMPIHPIGVEGKKGSLGCPYANRDYRTVNPTYGTMEDFKLLTEEIHKLGMKCMIDVVYNHTSPDSTLINEHPEFFYRDENGKTGNRMGDWADVIDLDYSSKALWDYQIESLKMWAGIVDGFRCDVASFLPVEFWKRARKEVAQINPDCIWLAESVHSKFGWFARHHGVNSALDYALFEAFDIEYEYDVRPTFERWLKGEIKLSHYLDMLNFQEVSYPMNYNKLRYLENHDLPRFASFVSDEKLMRNYLAMLYFNKGTTLLYAGQEFENTHTPSLFEREPIDRNTGADLSGQLRKLYEIKSKYLGADDSQWCDADDEHAVAVFTREGSRGKTAGIFSLKGESAEIAVELPDGDYINLIDSNIVSVKCSKLRTNGEPIIIKA